MGGSLTRRQFLGRAAGTVTVALPRGAWQPAPALATVVLDLKEHCSLGESLTGYESALASSGTRCLRDDGRGVPRCAALIVPAAVRIAAPALRAMVTALEAGATVILESGAAFAAEPDFSFHRDVLRDFLAVRIEPPVRLWPRPAHARPGGMPYVDYTWPHPAKLRDFSRVVPLGCDHGEEAEFIGWVDG
ncbi:MAG TPA: hypothetical protein VM736_07595, partial [Gemmatimonadales bacterium]|nr:hypothetical protein [Gemmatimonadales bacterium]